MQININPLTLQDLFLIETNFETNFDPFWSIELFKKELENKNSAYFVAKYNDEIVGLCGILLIFDEVHIMNIITKKEKRNLGIASQMLEKLIKQAIKWQAITMTLEVNEHNLPAIALYEKYHFKKVGIRKKYYDGTDNAIIMTLSLENYIIGGNK